jgi:hypothetical protein
LASGFSHASAIGFAIFDNELRYQTINSALAGMNGIPAEAHVGNTVRDIFGDVADNLLQPALQQVLTTGEAASPLEHSAVLPTRTEAGHWIDTWFPVNDDTGKTNHVGVLCVEITLQKQLEECLCKLAGELLHPKTKETFWLARELRYSVKQYHAALAISLDRLTRYDLQTETGAELFAQSVELLDQRVLAMQRLVSAVASRFPLTQEF